MEREEIRTVIKYFNIKGLTPAEIENELDSTLGDSAPSLSTVKEWAAEFKRGSISTNDAPSSGREPSSDKERQRVLEMIKEVEKSRSTYLRSQGPKKEKKADFWADPAFDRLRERSEARRGVSTKWPPFNLVSDLVGDYDGAEDYAKDGQPFHQNIGKPKSWDWELRDEK